MQHSNWIAQARAHWREFQPSKFRELMKSHQLEKALTEAAEATQREMDLLIAQGFKYQEAWEATREQYLFPPEESEASEEAPDSPGFKAMQEFNQGLGSLTLPGERED